MYTYDSLGRLVAAGDARFQYGEGEPVLRDMDGQTTQYTYDGHRRLVRTSGTDTAAYSYDTNGSLVAEADGAGVTRFTYDRSGRLTGITEPDGVATAFTYDAAGLLAQVAPDVGDEVLVGFQQGAPGSPFVIGALWSGDRGESFTLSLRGRLDTCSTCP